MFIVTTTGHTGATYSVFVERMGEVQDRVALAMKSPFVETVTVKEVLDV